MKLTSLELERYARHIVLQEVGGSGQQKLKQARVLVVGAGGLGSPVLQYLAAAGIGTIGIVDDDEVSLSNLQRQTIHSTAAIGTYKVESAAGALIEINPNVRVEKWPVRFNHENSLALLSQYDIAVDGSDNFSTRYALSDRCEEFKIPLVTAAVGKFEGTITTLKPFEKDDNSNLYPRYRDLFPTEPPTGMLPTCEEAGIIGALTGILGSLQAMEVIKLITGAGDCLIGRLLMVDAGRMTFEEISYKRKID